MTTSEKEFKVTLRISSRVHSLLEIIDILGKKPSRGHEKGEVISAKSLTPRFREESLWFLESGISKNSSIDEHLLKITEFIDNNFDSIRNLTLIGCDISLYCCLTTFNGQGGFVLTNEVIKKFSALPVDIVFDFYSIDG
jgi:hypothetical protein